MGSKPSEKKAETAEPVPETAQQVTEEHPSPEARDIQVSTGQIPPRTPEEDEAP